MNDLVRELQLSAAKAQLTHWRRLAPRSRRGLSNKWYDQRKLLGDNSGKLAREHYGPQHATKLAERSLEEVQRDLSVYLDLVIPYAFNKVSEGRWEVADLHDFVEWCATSPYVLVYGYGAWHGIPKPEPWLSIEGYDGSGADFCTLMLESMNPACYVCLMKSTGEPFTGDEQQSAYAELWFDIAMGGGFEVLLADCSDPRKLQFEIPWWGYTDSLDEGRGHELLLKYVLNGEGIRVTRKRKPFEHPDVGRICRYSYQRGDRRGVLGCDEWLGYSLEMLDHLDTLDLDAFATTYSPDDFGELCESDFEGSGIEILPLRDLAFCQRLEMPDNGNWDSLSCDPWEDFEWG